MARFKVTGANRQTGTHTTIIVDADGPTAAENQAADHGLEVHHVEHLVTQTVRVEPSIGIAGLLTLVIPGAGRMYRGNPIVGLLMFLSVWACYGFAIVTADMSFIPLFGMLLHIIYFALDATPDPEARPKAAQQKPADPPPAPKPPTAHELRVAEVESKKTMDDLRHLVARATAEAGILPNECDHLSTAELARILRNEPDHTFTRRVPDAAGLADLLELAGARARHLKQEAHQ